MEKEKCDLVKYNNVLNRLSIGKLEEKELELFFALCLELKEKGVDDVYINITEFKNRYNMGRSNIRFEKYLEVVLSKFLETKLIIKSSNGLEIGNFFRKFKIDFKNNNLYVQVDRDYSFILNDLVEMYTQFSFNQYQGLKSKYAKRLMPKLAQWNGTKKIEFEKEDLFEILGASESYKNDLSSFNKRILKPATAELKKVFSNLKVTPIKNNNSKTTNKIKSYLFSWSSKHTEEIKDAEEVKSIEISKTLKTLLDTAIKNPKLEILEKPSVVEYLLKNYTENIVILGIKQLLNSNITTKIKTRKYIVEVLENIKKKENIKITTKEETLKKLEAEEIKEVEKKVLTSDEWEKEFNRRIEEVIEKTGNKDNDILKMTVRVAMNRLYIKSEK
ncbi:replication initiation protein [Fusobacterium hwasookii]|uniref:replication initiation protein n=1 Tax=Fusobacterium hwasookii TaxID=1583098 RepID=UPI0028E282D6|nr:replication initiation protein [Fusobacterium hwasookii]